MAVDFTTNIGLAKPDAIEVAKNWATNTRLCEDNNLLIADHMSVDVALYSPTLTAQTTPPNVGASGSVTGEYQDLQGIIMGFFIVTFNGAGLAAGSGEYAVSLPAVADNAFHIVGSAFNSVPGAFSVIGEGFCYDASAAATSGILVIDLVTVGGVSYARMLTEAFTAPAKTSRMLNNAQPFVPAAGDILTGNFIYKKL